MVILFSFIKHQLSGYFKKEKEYHQIVFFMSEQNNHILVLFMLPNDEWRIGRVL